MGSKKDKNDKSDKNEWTIRVLLTFTALAIGFGVSQIALAGQVRENTTKISLIQKSLDRFELKLDKALGI